MNDEAYEDERLRRVEAQIGAALTAMQGTLREVNELRVEVRRRKRRRGLRLVDGGRTRPPVKTVTRLAGTVVRRITERTMMVVTVVIVAFVGLSFVVGAVALGRVGRDGGGRGDAVPRATVTVTASPGASHRDERAGRLTEGSSTSAPGHDAPRGAARGDPRPTPSGMDTTDAPPR